MSASTHDRYARLTALRPARRLDTPPCEEAGIPAGFMPDVPEGAEHLARLLGAEPRRNRFGEHLALRRWFPGPAVTSSEITPPEGTIDDSLLRLLAPSAPKEAADPRQWLFLDTETTGLAGGSGTYAFLVGLAWWDAGGLEVEQLFLREHSEEHSLLVALSERLAERPVLVTFNGKTFDWPLLETRYRMTRSIPLPAPRAHLDFLHPARNLWRAQLGSVRLAELERHVLSWNRGTDVMSELIPSIYFDFLRGGPPAPLIPIFRHNQMDLQGLAALACRVLSLLADPVQQGRDALEVWGVSRICERRGDAARARTFYERSVALDLPPEADRAARRSLALLAKRGGDFSRAVELWNGLAGSSRAGLEAYEQLAVHYEHHERQPQRAAAVVRQALAELRKAARLGTLAPSACERHKAQFERRLARLDRKVGRMFPEEGSGRGVSP